MLSEDKQSRSTTLGKSTAVYTVSTKEDSTAINNYELEAWPPRELIKRHLPHFSSLSVCSLCSTYPFCYSLSLNTKKNGKTCKYKEENWKTKPHSERRNLEERRAIENDYYGFQLAKHPLVHKCVGSYVIGLPNWPRLVVSFDFLLSMIVEHIIPLLVIIRD